MGAATSRRLVWIVTLSFVLFAGLLCAVNAYFNAYGLLPWQVRAVRPAKFPFDFAARSIQQIRGASADTFVLGNSRSSVGFRAEDQHVAGGMLNVAAPGFNLVETELLFREMLLRHAPSRLIVGLDPQMFTTKSVLPQLRTLNIGEPGGPALDMWRALKLSINGVMVWAELEHRLNAIPLGSEAAPGTGQRNVRHASLRAEKSLVPIPAHAMQPRVQANVDALKRMLSLSCGRGVSVDLLVMPYHVRLQEAFNYAYGARFFESLLRTLLDVRDQAAADCQSRSKFRLWAAFTYDERSMEPIPAETDVSGTMKWHVETSHFKAELGRLALQPILESMAPDSFGWPLQLGTNNIDRYLSRLALDRAAFLATRPEQLSVVRKH
ncbi:hypothetical protein [Roseateles sp. LYH14W]|uniref:Uncharacterized protein n=1 Tax=Pelomonas parva TaxID=3299032 RepID=A0ABW7EZI7_9BURK